MGRVNLLDKDTANKIAAGEVVERPSSVVKELVENSIDANSKNITIEIENGGCSLIRIIDDGDGIHEDDVELSFMPHATSKIKSTDDIFSISTLGFRGEALPSIASVSKVNLKSKREEAEFGREVIIEGGKIISNTECGTNKGTTIEVCNLFYNVPARLEFLKSFTREGSVITDIINRIAIANPKISFKLYNNGKKVVQTFGNGSLKDVLRAIYGKKISENLLYFEVNKENLKVSGYIGKEEIARGSRNNQSIFVNSRYIKNKSLVVAVENAFKSFSTVSKFPFFVLMIDVFPEFVDVNIHPTKAEIKFRDERFIFKAVFEAVHKALKDDVFETFRIKDSEIEEVNTIKANYKEEALSFDITDNQKVSYRGETVETIEKENLSDEILKEQNELDRLKEKVAKTKIKTHENEPTSNYEYMVENLEPKCNNLENANILYSEKPIENRKDFSIEVSKNEKEEKVAKFPPLKIIGQFNKTYILGEFNETLYLIDQHVAHEKILFEKYLDAIKNSNLIVQPLLVPTLLELTTDDLAYYEENKEIFIDSGFLIEEFGGNTLSLKEVPYFLGKIDSKSLFFDILDNLKNLGTGKTEEVKYNKIATMACKAAIKANDYLNEQEMIKLIEDLRFINDPFHCPHGRPVIIKFTATDLDKKFRRII